MTITNATTLTDAAKTAFEAVISLIPKGIPISLQGPSGSGKTTCLSGLTDSGYTQFLLASGEASGKGSIHKTVYIATDDPDIPTDCLFVYGRMRSFSLDQYNDDLDLLGNVMYSFVKEYVKSSDNSKAVAAGLKTLINSLQHHINASLAAYLTANLSPDDSCEDHPIVIKVEEMLNTLTEDQINSLRSQFLFSKDKKGQKKVTGFIDQLAKDKAFDEFIGTFWKNVEEYLSGEADIARELLIKANAVFDGNEFIVKFDGADMFKGDEPDADSVALKASRMLLSPEDGKSMAHLIENMSVVFRVTDGLLSGIDGDTDRFVVAIKKDPGDPSKEIKVRMLRLDDNMGIGHKSINAKEESERVTESIKTSFCPITILMIDSNINSTTKDGIETIDNFLRDYNGNLKVYIVFTHFDTYLRSFGAKLTATGASRVANRFSKHTGVDPEKAYTEAINAQEEIIAGLRKALENNINKKKPEIIAVYRVGMLMTNDEFEKFLSDKKIEYPDLWNELICSLHVQFLPFSNKVIVNSDILIPLEPEEAKGAIVSFGPTLKKQNITELRRNLGECIDLTQGVNRLWPSTAMAVRNHWQYSGDSHISNIQKEEDGYVNINTQFVREIRNLARTYINTDSIVFSDLSKYIEEDKREKFINDFVEFASDNFGRRLAMTVYKDVNKAFNASGSGCNYEYMRVNELFKTTSAVFFYDEVADPVNNKALGDAFARTLNECLKAYINYRCITC